MRNLFFQKQTLNLVNSKQDAIQIFNELYSDKEPNTDSMITVINLGSDFELYKGRSFIGTVNKKKGFFKAFSRGAFVFTKKKAIELFSLQYSDDSYMLFAFEFGPDYLIFHHGEKKIIGKVSSKGIIHRFVDDEGLALEMFKKVYPDLDPTSAQHRSVYFNIYNGDNNLVGYVEKATGLSSKYYPPDYSRGAWGF